MLCMILTCKSKSYSKLPTNGLADIKNRIIETDFYTLNIEQSRAEQSRAEQSRAEQSRAEQSRAEQSRAEQSRAEQSRALIPKNYSLFNA